MLFQAFCFERYFNFNCLCLEVHIGIYMYSVRTKSGHALHAPFVERLGSVSPVYYIFNVVMSPALS